MMEEGSQSSLVGTLLQIWSRRKWMLMGIFIAVFAASVSLVLALPSMYRSSTSILFGQDMISESLVRSDTGGSLDQRLQIIQQGIMSRSQLADLIERMDLYPELRRIAPVEVVVNQMRRDLTIQRQAGTQTQQYGQRVTIVVTISYRGWDAETVAAVANEIARLYRVEYEGIRLGQASSTTAFLGQQLEEVGARLSAQEERINDFKTQHLGHLPQQEGMNLSTLERLNAELRLNSENQFQLLNQSAAGDGRVAVMAGLSGEARLSALRQELEAMSIRYNDAYPGIIRLKSEIASLERRLANEETSDTAGDAISESERLRREELDLRARIQELQKRIDMTPTVEQELNQLNSDYSRILEEYGSLQRRYQEARLAESLEMQQTRQYQVLETAIPPAFPYAPNSTMLLILCLIAAGGASVGTVFIRENMDGSFHTVEELRAFTRLPVLGSISSLRTRAERYRSVAVSVFLFIGFAAGVVLLVLAANQYGSGAKNLVWMLAGGAA